MRLPLVVAVATHLSVINAFAQSATFARTDYPFLGNDHIVFDLNRDGRMDMVATGIASVRVMLGNGDGTFGPRVEFPVSASAHPQAVAAGDFNRDGVPDVMVTLNDPQIGFALITGFGDGSFSPPVHFPNVTGSDSPAIAAVDLDNDGNLDVVAGHGIACYQAPCIAARFITVMPGRGDGSFEAARAIEVGSDTAAIGVGDFNRDAFSDLVLASSSSRVHVLLGRGDGTFAQQTLTLIPENNLGMDNTDIDVADVNADLIDDVVVALSLNGSKTVILIGNGDGSFREPHFIQEPDIRIPQYQAVADYNGDGRLDLALSLAWGSQGLMEIRNGNGDGTFGPLVLYLVPPDKSSIGGGKIASADFNGDGKADIALGWIGASAGLAVLTNTTGTAPPPRPSAPSLVSPSDGVTVAQPVTLDWTDVTHAVNYEVQVDNSSTISSPFVANVTVTTSGDAQRLAGAATVVTRARAQLGRGIWTVLVRPPLHTAIRARTCVAVIGGPQSVQRDGRDVVGRDGDAQCGCAERRRRGGPREQPDVRRHRAGEHYRACRRGERDVYRDDIRRQHVDGGDRLGGLQRCHEVRGADRESSRTDGSAHGERNGPQRRTRALEPIGHQLSVGTTGSAAFNVGTSITLSVTNGRDAIWSGACSRGGEKRRTCTFTLNANAAVTATVQ